MRTDILERKEDIEAWIKANQSKAFMCRELKCRPDTLNSYLVKMGIKYEGNQGGFGIKSDPKRLTAEEYIKSTTVKSSVLKKKLIEDGIKEAKCECCGLSEWMGKPIPLELHHIDGDRYNNLIINLEILCPNCHTFTDNYGAKNIGNYD